MQDEKVLEIFTQQNTYNKHFTVHLKMVSMVYFLLSGFFFNHSNKKIERMWAHDFLSLTSLLTNNTNGLQIFLGSKFILQGKFYGKMTLEKKQKN